MVNIPEAPWWVYPAIAVWVLGGVAWNVAEGIPIPWYEIAFLVPSVPLFLWVGYREWRSDLEEIEEMKNV